jgi:murein DD-endopeptidase MepM/ murein hydrolase activator NlpD
VRRVVLISPALALAIALASAAGAASVVASTANAVAPAGGTGGTPYREVAPPRPHQVAQRRPSRGPLLRAFSLNRPRLFLFGHPARVSFRIDSRYRSVRVRLSLLPLGSRRAASTIDLGQRRTGLLQSILLTGREQGILPQGPYRLRISARDRRGRGLRRLARVSAEAALSFFHYRFPLVGPFSFGGPDARFGAPRVGHIHQGQDVIAAAGTPIVAPRGGVIQVVAYQAGGAGYYVVLRGADEDRNYVLMHLAAGSTRVRVGQRVRTGQRIGDVGATGNASGPHLHFEVWVGGWFSGGHPIDPLPLLERWASWS